MKLAFKVLLLVILIGVGKWEKENHTIVSKPTRNVYSPVYSQNLNHGVNSRTAPEQEMQKISVNYNHY